MCSFVSVYTTVIDRIYLQCKSYLAVAWRFTLESSTAETTPDVTSAGHTLFVVGGRSFVALRALIAALAGKSFLAFTVTRVLINGKLSLTESSLLLEV